MTLLFYRRARSANVITGEKKKMLELLYPAKYKTISTDTMWSILSIALEVPKSLRTSDAPPPRLYGCRKFTNRMFLLALLETPQILSLTH